MSLLALKAARQLTPHRDVAEIEAKSGTINAWVDGRDTFASPNVYPFADPRRFRSVFEMALEDSVACGEVDAQVFIDRAARYLALQDRDGQPC